MNPQRGTGFQIEQEDVSHVRHVRIGDRLICNSVAAKVVDGLKTSTYFTLGQHNCSCSFVPQSDFGTYVTPVVTIPELPPDEPDAIGSLIDTTDTISQFSQVCCPFDSTIVLKK